MMGKRGGLVVLNELSEKVAFEVAVGRNGRVWIAAGDGDVKIPVIVGRALQECDEKNLDEKGQRECVRRLLKGI
jgi:exosome complex component RRP40